MPVWTCLKQTEEQQEEEVEGPAARAGGSGAARYRHSLCSGDKMSIHAHQLLTSEVSLSREISKYCDQPKKAQEALI